MKLTVAQAEKWLHENKAVVSYGCGPRGNKVLIQLWVGAWHTLSMVATTKSLVSAVRKLKPMKEAAEKERRVQLIQSLHRAANQPKPEVRVLDAET